MSGAVEETPSRRRTDAELRTLIRDAMRETFAEGLSEEDRRRIIKQAIDEWLEKKYAQVGIWTLGAVITATVGFIAYAVLVQRGWRPPH